jgi:hypothetical protein
VIEGRKIIIAGNDIYYTGLMRGQLTLVAVRLMHLHLQLVLLRTQ